MIRVQVRYPRTTVWRAWRRECDTTLKMLKSSGSPYEIEDDLYKRCADQFFDAYHKKCAYCEGPLYAQSSGEVEHFRPKSGVRDLKNKIVYVGPKKRHAGYWWLAYEPENLLAACIMCNRFTRKRRGKGERFPLRDGEFRATRPGEERRERPLLIHPGLEDPSGALTLDLTNGMLIALNDRGAACIEVFGLNRGELARARYLEAQNATMFLCAKKPAKGVQVRIDEQLRGSLPYAMVWRTVKQQVARARGHRSSSFK